jgi:hypothetical protein
MPALKAYAYGRSYQSYTTAAPTKKTASEQFQALFSPQEQAETSAATRAKYVGELFYCPRNQRLWYNFGKRPAVIRETSVGAGVWALIPIKECDKDLSRERDWNDRVTALSPEDFKAKRGF